jgi:hypothetical protein
MDRLDVRELPGYKTFPEAAEEVGVSKQYLYKLAESGRFFKDQEVVRVGSKPIYLVTVVGVARLKAARQRALDRRTQNQAEAKKGHAVVTIEEILASQPQELENPTSDG